MAAAIARAKAKKAAQQTDSTLSDTTSDNGDIQPNDTDPRKAAVAAASTQHYDLIVMDIEMPILNGLEATRSIIAGDGPNRNTPIIAMTASVLEEDRQRILDAGMKGVVGKPVRLKQLTQELDRLLVN